MTKRIRITGSGIYGMPATDENSTGEYPVGFEFDTEGELPPGWKGRAVVVGEDPAEGSVFVGNDDDADDRIEAVRRELIEKANAEFERITADHAKVLGAETSRADAAEKANADLVARITELTAKLAEPATAAEIIAAVGLLDPKSDAHWTDAGLPRVEAVAEITGKAVTRAQIEAAAPDAKRPE